MSLGKFSEIPYNLLLEYFTAVLENLSPTGEGTTTGITDLHQYSNIKNTILNRGRSIIITNSGFWNDFFIKTTDEYLKTKLATNPLLVEESNNSRFLKFDRGETNSMVVSPPTDGMWEIGNEVYLRKDSLFHEWYKRRLNSDETTPYFNINKFFSYIGKIYKASNYSTDFGNVIALNETKFGAANTHWQIEVITQDLWATAAVPENQQTENLKELFFIFFDKIYSSIHNKIKALWSNLDPMEIPIELIFYLGLGYKIILDDTLPEMVKREFVRDIIYFLKRKGSYTSLYIIWYLLTEGTINRFNVYERWHNWELPEIAPLHYFEDQLYQSFYGKYSNVTGSETSHGAGQPVSSGASITEGEDSWYIYYYDKNNYFNYTLSTESEALTGAKELSPHYRVELDLSDEPLSVDINDASNTKIISEDLINNLLDNFEVVRPASRFSHYNYLLGIDVDLSGNWVPNYIDPSILNTMYMQHLENLNGIPNTIIFKQSFMSATWTIYHTLNTQNFIIQCYDWNFELIEPTDIIIDTNDKITIVFDKPIVGWMFATKADISLPGSTAIKITHNLNSKDIIVLAENEDRKIIPTQVVTVENLNEVTVVFPNMDDIPRILIKKAVVGQSHVAEYSTSGGSPYIFTATHNLGTINLIATAYDFGTYSEVPIKSLRYLDANNIEFEFDSYQHVIVVIQMTSDSQLFDGTSVILNHNQGEQCLATILNTSTNYKVESSNINYIQNDFDGNNTSASLSTSIDGMLLVTKADFVYYMESWVEEHNQNERYQLSEFHKSTGYRFVPREVILSTANILIGVISKTWQNLTGTSKIEEYDYIWYQDDLASSPNIPFDIENPSIKGAGPHGLGEATTWRMAHNLGNLVNVIQFFNEEHEEIYPDSVAILGPNSTIATFAYPMKGYALFKVIGNISYDTAYVEDIKYYELGDGSTWEWDPSLNLSLESMSVSGSIKELREDDEYYYIDIDDTHNQEINITEIGLFDSTMKMIFYSKCKDIFKPENVGIMLHYKIKKLTF